MIRKTICSLLRLFIPADGEEPETPPAEEAPVETTLEAPAVEEPSEVERLRNQVAEMEARHNESVREEAERLLMDMVPEAADPNYQQQPQAPNLEPPEDDTYLTPEERLERLEARTQQDSLDRESELLVAELNQLKVQNYPHMEIGEVLNILAVRPDLNRAKLAEMSHNRQVDRMESYHRDKMNNPEYRQSLGLPETPEGGTPAEPRREPPRLPSSGPTTAGGEPITTKNAPRILTERLKAAGWGNG